MQLSYDDDQNAFRHEVRAFMRDHAPADLAEKTRTGRRFSKDDLKRWHRILYERGWVAPKWPAEVGGGGLDPIQVHILDEEAFAAGMPRLQNFGLGMVGPVIIHFGSDDQKARYLPKILSGEEFWCQGFSEPGSGSDLASLSTRAERKGDVYVVNGQKTWTTQAHWADWMFCLVRTDRDVKQQEGISFLLIDMTTPGITVRPIITLDGEHAVNEVFLDNVEVPAANLVGGLNKGWDYAKFLLSNERTGIAGVGQSKSEFARLKAIAATEKRRGKPLAVDPLFQAKLTELELKLRALEITNMRMLMEEKAKGSPGPISSILKIVGTEVQQEIATLTMEACGTYAAPFLPEALEDSWNDEAVGPDYAAHATPTYFFRRKASIYGGSNEIQRNIIAKQLLGL
ncbi:MAG: acyl-CoA dehydrogenase family protein [Rhodospirillaceae bacterium]